MAIGRRNQRKTKEEVEVESKGRGIHQPESSRKYVHHGKIFAPFYTYFLCCYLDFLDDLLWPPEAYLLAVGFRYGYHVIHLAFLLIFKLLGLGYSAFMLHSHLISLRLV